MASADLRCASSAAWINACRTIEKVGTVNRPASPPTTNAGLGMDISGASGILYVTHDSPTNASVMGLYTRDTSTGAETSIGSYPNGTFVADISVGRNPADLITFINPEFVERDGMQLEEEGCLSVPGFNATLARPSRAGRTTSSPA